MKKFTLSFVFLFTFLIVNVQADPNPFWSGFHIGTFHFPNMPSYRTSQFFNKYSELNYNSMIGYIAHCDTDFSCGSNGMLWGGFYDITSGYSPNVNSMINGFNANYNNNFQLILEREKILRPAYGQSSVYQAEYNISDTQNIRPAYLYSNVKGDVVYDADNIKSRRCLKGVDSAGYMLKGLFENLEQVNVNDNSTNSNSFNLWYNMGDRKNNGHSWFIKPSMKIDSIFAANNLDTAIVAVVTKNIIGRTIDSTVITCRNFGKMNNGSFYYNNTYKEYFYKGNNPNENILFFINVKTDSLLDNTNRRNGYTSPEVLNDCKVDYQVYWFGKVDVMIDYVKVEDEWAHYLMTDTTLLLDDKYKFRRRINDELDLFTGKYGTVPYFYLDEFCYNNIPCIAFVDSLIKLQNINSGLIVLLNDWWTRSLGGGLKHGPQYANNYDYLINRSAIDDMLLTEIYPFDEAMPLPTTIPRLPSTSEYPATIGYRQASNNNNYSDTLNFFLERGYEYDPSGNSPGTVPSFMDRFRKCAFSLKNRNLKSLAIAVPFHTEESTSTEQLREPTLEEMSLMCYLSLAYGANAIFQFSYPSKEIDKSEHFFAWGIDSLKTDTLCYSTSNKRIYNYYGQPKWDGITKLDSALRKIGDFIYDKTKGKLIYDDTRTINTKFGSTNDGTQWGLPFKYVQNIKSIYSDLTNGIYYDVNCDPTEKRYWEFGFFNPRQSETNDKSKYLLALNKRCAPTDPSFGITDIRLLKIKFDKNQLTGFDNWMIKDAVNDSIISVFDKNTEEYIVAGEFQPGEGKLLKFAPVMQEGGALAGDETLSGNVNCEGMIYGNGHNITISPSTTISFSDSAGIEMNGGVFTCGDNSSANTNVILKGKDNNTNTWNGLVLSNCSSIGIYRTNISKIIANDTAKAVLISNCNNINISNTSFSMGTNAGAIQAVFTAVSDEPPTFNVSNCSFDMGSSSYSALSIISNASYSLPLIIEWCSFNSSNDTTNALLLSGVTGGAIKNNLFLNFNSTLNTLGSVIDLYNNTILGKDNSTGIFCVDESSISLSPNSGQYLGGYNYIKNYGSSSSNIHSISSTFNIDAGQNDFDLNDIDNSKHFTGTMSGIPLLYVNAAKNCFHKDSITNIDASHSVVWDVSTDPVNFIFTDYSCELTPPGDYFVYQYGGYNDTVYYRSGGEGGGFTPNKIINIEVNAYKTLKDTININLRKRNYLTVEEKTKQILTQFPDSLESSGMVQKLYMASLSLDSTKIGITKTFLENLIVNNSQNPSLVKRAFYFIQKCKVKLGLYQSALDGFQYIMTQNPYTYEGLVASWDYAATYLLMGSGGSNAGNFEQTTEELNTPADTLLSRMTKRDINTNKSINKSTNTNPNNTSIEQITKTFYEKIKNVTKDDKSIQEAKIKTLEKKIETTKNKSEKNEAKRELATMKQINEVVKVKKPNTVMTHVAILNSDIKKVFGIGKGSKDESKNNLIPTTYTLYQNYPNPFNPVTKIAYDIPRDAKVKLVIYDILGREMKTLVNNEFKTAGKYITEFNGSYLSSGIYFARILVNDGKEFIAVKKMVLLK